MLPSTSSCSSEQIPALGGKEKHLWDVPALLRPCRAPRVQQTAPAGLCPCQLHPLLICYGKSSGKSVELFKSPAPVPCEQYPFHICRMIKSLVTSLLLESSSRSIINPCSQPARGLRALLFQDLKIYLSSLTALISSCREQQCLNRNL